MKESVLAYLLPPPPLKVQQVLPNLHVGHIFNWDPSSTNPSDFFQTKLENEGITPSSFEVEILYKTQGSMIPMLTRKSREQIKLRDKYFSNLLLSEEYLNHPNSFAIIQRAIIPVAVLERIKGICKQIQIEDLLPPIIEVLCLSHLHVSCFNSFLTHNVSHNKKIGQEIKDLENLLEASKDSGNVSTKIRLSLGNITAKVSSPIICNDLLHGYREYLSGKKGVSWQYNLREYGQIQQWKNNDFTKEFCTCFTELIKKESIKYKDNYNIAKTPNELMRAVGDLANLVGLNVFSEDEAIKVKATMVRNKIIDGEPKLCPDAERNILFEIFPKHIAIKLINTTGEYTDYLQAKSILNSHNIVGSEPEIGLLLHLLKSLRSHLVRFKHQNSKYKVGSLDQFIEGLAIDKKTAISSNSSLSQPKSHHQILQHLNKKLKEVHRETKLLLYLTSFNIRFDERLQPNIYRTEKDQRSLIEEITIGLYAYFVM